MWHYNIWLLALLTCLVSVAAGIEGNKKDNYIPRRLKVGAPCLLDNGKKGVCKRLNDCPKAIRDIDQNGAYPRICSFIIFEAVVCCDRPKDMFPSRQIKPINNLNATKVTLQTSTQSTTVRMTKVVAPSTTTTTTTELPSTTTMISYAKAAKIAKKKCLEYSRWLSSPTMDTPQGEKIAGTCGISVEKFIYGGEEASDTEFPHMVRLGYGNKARPHYGCGASLISEKYLLTAAHCLNSPEPLNVALLGTGDDTTQLLVEIKNRISYERDSRTRYDDIALLELKEPLEEFTNTIRPACIQTEKEINETEGIASGWGVVNDSGVVSIPLMKVNLTFLNHSDCSGRYEKNEFLYKRGIDDKSMVCAGGWWEKKDICDGDSGGPLQVRHPDKNLCMYNIVGITSFGQICGQTASIFTRVSNYVPWIVSRVWPEG